MTKLIYQSHTNLPEPIKGIHRLFKKNELQGIATELSLESFKSMNVRNLVLTIANNLEDEGIPEVENCSDSLFEFLLNTNYIDEDGDVQELEISTGGGVEEEESTEILDEDIPECFTYADNRDPACNRCKLYINCYEERISSRPRCFGREFSSQAEECQNCLEFADCNIVSSQ
ncbi:hypothetical protein LCGC14_0506710 [marine sediment metagenome]|uniref:Uncharacterized protein n=1 Tax=marine sediment metagenome TaxID=412755 RepID=A0A0F9UP24_9ZZZZ